MARGRPKVSKTEPKWRSSLPRNRTRTQDPKKRAQYAIRTLFTRFQAHRTSQKRSLFRSGGHPKRKEKSGLRPRSLKNVEKAGQREQKNGTGGPQGGPRVGQGLQNELQIDPKLMEKRGSGPSLHPKGARGAPGAPKSSQIDEMSIFLLSESEAQ